MGIPAVIFGVAFLLTYTQPPLILYGTRAVIILVYIALMIPFCMRLQMTALMSPGETYNEASSTSGASAFVTSRQITLPLMRPAILSAVALMFILLTHEFARVTAGAFADHAGHGHPALRPVDERGLPAGRRHGDPDDGGHWAGSLRGDAYRRPERA